MNAPGSPEFTQQLRLIVRQELQRALAPLLPKPLPPAQQELLDALVPVFGTRPFTSAEVLELAAGAGVQTRRRLAAALAAAGGTDSHRLGLALAGIADRTRGREPRLVKLSREAGSRLWGVEGIDSPQAP
ncbi:MAG: hypothetical protein KF683_00880 [Rubrivivax sp.]|nr:hypothetical protein [Rubrivivax sp.]